jgi:hypothetical protein
MINFMRNNRCTFVATFVSASLYGCSAWAQERVEAGPPNGATSPITSLLLLALPAFCIGVLLVLMRRSNRMQPKVDKSLQIGEEGLKLAREQVALQTETNRLLGRLIEVLSRTERNA